MVESLDDGGDGDEQIHVLAVDDSVVDRKVIEILLKTSSFKVTTVGSGAKALEILGAGDNCGAPNFVQAFQVNLIITDYCMPEMTGYDLLKKLKEETSTLREIPVVIMSSENVPSRKRRIGYSTQDEEFLQKFYMGLGFSALQAYLTGLRCLAEGAEEFILKPVRLDDVKRLKGHVRFPPHLAVSDPFRGESTCMERNSTIPERHSLSDIAAIPSSLLHPPVSVNKR